MASLKDDTVIQLQRISTICKLKVPVVVVWCMTYNHANYIKEALDGFVTQIASFPFIVIVHDDASSDKTSEIVCEYGEKYSDIIYPIIETENQYSKQDGSLDYIMKAAIKATGAKYIAMCEGDDYWTDPLKLQKQVDFLENHSDYSFCCARFQKYNQVDNIFTKEYAFDYYLEGIDLEITKSIFFKIWVTQPLTALFRSESYLKSIVALKKYKYSRDVHLFYHLLKQGKGCSLNQFVGIYRIHSKGVAGTRNALQCVRDSKNIYWELWWYNKNDWHLFFYLVYVLLLFVYRKYLSRDIQ